MEVIRNALLPRRITQIYTDTKRFYEQLIQEHVTNPQASALHLKLRIQKDRLVAWGIDWADTRAQQGDIDDSLDRAGISDLVSSIMSSIRELLDDAEKVEPSFQPPGRVPDQKGGFLSMPNRQWTAEDLARLDDLVKSITTSIDTLCDLSRSTQGVREDSPSGEKKKASRFSGLSAHSSKVQSRCSTPIFNSPTATSFSFPGVSNLVRSMRIHPRRLRFPHPSSVPDSPPPTYDTVTASADNRKFALLRPEEPLSQASEKLGQKSMTGPSETPVLVDYGCSFDYVSPSDDLPTLHRFESLVLALQSPERDDDDLYTGCFRILGWFADAQHTRFCFIYEVPQPNPMNQNPRFNVAPPMTLLSFLQHSGNTDSENTPCLEDRFRLALNLVTNLLHTHAKGVTHRCINSNNVIFVENSLRTQDSKPWKDGMIRKPYLVSWDQGSEDAVSPEAEMLVPRLYRPPNSKVGLRSSFKSAYDVYSLGLVLLEIGLWLPLHKLWKTKYTPSIFGRKLKTTYAHKLAGKCGTAYMQVVDYCLNAADMEAAAPSSQRFSQDFQQSKKQEEFYWKALKPLERCCLIDESNEPVLHPLPSMAGLKTEAMDISESQAGSTPEPIPVEQPAECLEADSLIEQGRTCPVLVWSYEIPSEIRDYYRKVMIPKMNKMFARAINRWESYTIMTFMAGDTPQTAKPTIFMSCLSIVRAWKILDYVNKDQQYFDIKVSVGQTCYSKASKKHGKRSKKRPRPNASADHNNQTSNPTKYQRKPSCGASISAFVDEQHLERATFGGIVLADGEPFGMSVHHMLEDLDVDQGLNYTLDEEAIDLAQADSNSDESSSSGLGQPPKNYFATSYLQDDDFDPRILDQDFGDEDEELINMGDTMGTSAGAGRDKIVTQPALDDVDPAFFPNEDDKSDEHLSSHGLGYIHASSGRRQVRYGASNIAHEVDWALFKVCDGRLESRNKVCGGEKYCKIASDAISSGPHPCQVVATDDLGDREVHAIGATSGLASGTILPEMVEQKMPGRVFSSTVWRFKGDFGGMYLLPTAMPMSSSLTCLQWVVTQAPGSSIMLPARSAGTSQRGMNAALMASSRPWK